MKIASKSPSKSDDKKKAEKITAPAKHDEKKAEPTKKSIDKKSDDIISKAKNDVKKSESPKKDVKKTDEEIIERFSIFNSSRFKSKKIFKIDNNLSKKDTINNILCILSKNINENN